jgi:hypothetical protein
MLELTKIYINFIGICSVISEDSLVVLKNYNLNLVATKFAYLKLPRIIFMVSRIMLISGSQGLLNLLSTNR